MKCISIVTACYNEEANIEELYSRVKAEMSKLGGYDYEHIFIDNASTDRTQELLRKIAARDKRVKVIINTRNFGHIRSPNYALMQAQGDAVISIVADLQDPVELLPVFVRHWESGSKIVAGIKKSSAESGLMFFVRRMYYKLIKALSDVEQLENFTGFGLYDRNVMDVVRKINDPYPYFRGLIADLGFAITKVEYDQPGRARGITKNNFYTLYDMAMLGITNYSKIPLRMATFLGFGLSMLSLVVALVYFIYKIMFWYSFSVGMAPLVIGLFFFSSVQLFFIGIIGEYIGEIHTQTLRRPMVVEKERINF